MTYSTYDQLLHIVHQLLQIFIVQLLNFFLAIFSITNQFWWQYHVISVHLIVFFELVIFSQTMFVWVPSLCTNLCIYTYICIYD